MKFDRYLKTIDAALDRYMPKAHVRPKAIHKAMRYSVFSGGKRIRPVIVLEAARSCGGPGKDAVAAACAIELVHAFSLIHDDLPSMDNDDFRRGKPTCHKVFGEATAILAGDALLVLAFNVIARGMKPSLVAAASAELSDAIGSLGMMGGQVVDLEYQDKTKSAATIEYINRLKTARLFQASAKLGGISAGASPARVAALALYGVGLGNAFQIVDDILDREGHATLFGQSRARSDARKIIENVARPLAGFGAKADGLRSIADFVLERIR